MIYRVLFYQIENGEKPVSVFLETLRTENSELHKLVTAGLSKLRDSDNHGKPLTDDVQESVGVLEMRVGKKNIARVFFFFRPGQEIICTNGYVKKAQKLDPGEVDRAARYKQDWERRYPVTGGEHGSQKSKSKVSGSRHKRAR